jgi:Protein of unknown function (DUF2877)
MKFNAISLTPTVNDWLTKSRQPCILHVFDQACNLINEHQEVLSVVTPEIGNGPFNLVLEDDVLFPRHFDIESSVSFYDNRLTLGDLTVKTAEAKLWDPRLAQEGLYAKREDILNQIMSLLFIHYQSSLPTQLLFTFSASLVAADLAASLTSTKQLAGLGIGLTPAGDDFIMGAIYAAWIIHPTDMAKVLAEEISNTAAPLTTSLSSAWLKSAGRGEAGIRWHEFFESLISGDPASIQKAMDKILADGETSGVDALAGFISVFAAQRNR